MSIFDSTPVQELVNLPIVSLIRRNHGLEHATLHILAQRYPGRPLAGHSDTGGFWLLGDVPTDGLQQAVEEALRRLRAGEERLAVHPNCGTNFVTAGSLAGLAAVLGMLGVGERRRDKFERLPLVVTLATLALILAQPLGLALQRNVTTSGQPGALEVVSITPGKRAGMPAHRVKTRS
jgi:hypothetical protein